MQLLVGAPWRLSTTVYAWRGPSTSAAGVARNKGSSVKHE
jgi:hypothetical protein